MNNDASKVVGALLIGAAAGAVLGLLFAPKSGTETRQLISDKANDLVGDLKSKIEEGKSIISDITSKLVATSEEFGKKAQNSTSSNPTGSRPVHV